MAGISQIIRFTVCTKRSFWLIFFFGNFAFAKINPREIFSYPSIAKINPREIFENAIREN